MGHWQSQHHSTISPDSLTSSESRRSPRASEVITRLFKFSGQPACRKIPTLFECSTNSTVRTRNPSSSSSTDRSSTQPEATCSSTVVLDLATTSSTSTSSSSTHSSATVTACAVTVGLVVPVLGKGPNAAGLPRSQTYLPPPPGPGPGPNCPTQASRLSSGTVISRPPRAVTRNFKTRPWNSGTYPPWHGTRYHWQLEYGRPL
eukprot:2588256-Rhodomonas_salina.1